MSPTAAPMDAMISSSGRSVLALRASELAMPGGAMEDLRRAMGVLKVTDLIRAEIHTNGIAPTSAVRGTRTCARR